MTLPKDDPLVGAARSGELSEDAFATATVLFGSVSPTTVESWFGPTVTLPHGAAEATISVSTTEHLATVRERRVFSLNGGVLSVALTDAHITSVNGGADVAEQSSTTLRVRLRAGDVVAVGIRPSDSSTQAVMFASDLSLFSAGAFAFRDFVWPGLLAAVPWLVFLVLQRRRTEVWLRFRWLLAIGLVAHTVLVGLTVLSIVNQAPAEELRSQLDVVRMNGLPIAQYAVVPGTTVLLICCLTFVPTYGVRHFHRAEGAHARDWFLFGWLAAAVVLWASAVGVYAWTLTQNLFDGLFSVALSIGVVLSLVAAVITMLFVSRRRVGALVGLVLIGLPLTVLASLHDRVGLVPSALRIAVPVATGVTALLALAHPVLGATRPGSRPGRWVWWVIGAIAVAVSIPIPVSAAQWFNLTEFGSGLDSLLATTLAIVLACTLYHAEKSTDGSASVAQWRLGLACAFVVLAGAFSFTARTSLVFLVAAAASAWWLLPRRQRDAAARLEHLTAGDRRTAVNRLVSAGEARRLLGSLRKSMRDRAASGEVAFAAMSDQVATVERVAAGRRVAVNGLTLEERALGTSVHGRRSRIVRGAVVGVVVGLPWTAIALYGATTTAPANRSYPILGVLIDIGPQLLRWAAYGVLFTYFFPLLRGRTGLAKAMCLFVAISVPTVVDTVPSGVGATGWQTVTLAVVQAFSFAMTIGLLADREVLLAQGYEGSRLADIHNLGAFAAWASSIAISVGTAVATALLVGLQPFLIPNLDPAPVPQPLPPAEAPR